MSNSTNESGARLSPEAKLAVQKYMWSSIMIPGGAIAILTFLAGFLIKDVFTEKAQNTTLSLAYDNLQKVSEQTLQASVQAKAAAIEAGNAKESASRLLLEAEDLRKRLERAENFQKSEELVSDIVAELKKSDFADEIANSLSTHLPISAKSKVANIRSGTTPIGSTAWQNYKEGKTGAIFVTVDTSHAGFTETPLYLINITGHSNHWTALGTASVYRPSRTEFSVYLQQPNITPAIANKYEWVVTWLAVGE